jgi:hypothetical protein
VGGVCPSKDASDHRHPTGWPACVVASDTVTTPEVEKVRFASDRPNVVANADGGATVTLRLREEPHQLVREVIRSWPCPGELITSLDVDGLQLVIEVPQVEVIPNAVEWLLLLDGRKSAPIAQMVNRARAIEATTQQAEAKLIEFLGQIAILDRGGAESPPE